MGYTKFIVDCIAILPVVPMKELRVQQFSYSDHFSNIYMK